MRLVSGVGSEEVEFEPIIPLEGKVEIYMQVTNVDIREMRFMCNTPLCRLTYGSSGITATLLPASSSFTAPYLVGRIFLFNCCC